MTKFDINTASEIALEVVEERGHQFDQWGEQNHPSLYSMAEQRRFAEAEVKWKQINDARVEAGTLTWDGILLEEVYEALASENPLDRRDELIQVAAVALAEVESIDRQLTDKPANCPVTGEPCIEGCENTCVLDERDDDNEEDDK